MAPELFEGAEATEASDTYSLGIMLWRDLWSLEAPEPLKALFQAMASLDRTNRPVLDNLEHKLELAVARVMDRSWWAMTRSVLERSADAIMSLPV